MNNIDAIQFIIPVFCVATMFAMGLNVTQADIVAPFRNKLALVIIILVNNILVPLLGFMIVTLPTLLTGGMFANLISQLVPLTGDQQTGFFLLILVSGSLMGPMLATLAGAKLPFAKGTMIIAVVASTLLIPFQWDLLARFHVVQFGIGANTLLSKLLLYQLLPFALGIIIKIRYDLIAVRLHPLVVQLTGLTFLILLTTLVTFVQGKEISMVNNTILSNEVKPDDTIIIDLNRSSPEIAKELSAQLSKYPLPPENQRKLLKVLSGWMIANIETTYTVEVTGNAKNNNLKLTIFNKNLLNQSIDLFPGTGDNANSNRQASIDELELGKITNELRADFVTQNKQGLQLQSDLVVAVKEGNEWALVNANQTYFLEYDGTQLKVYQKITPSLGITSKFMQALAALPVLGPISTFLTQFIKFVWPYALLAAMAVILMLIGYYAGVVIRNVVGTTSVDIPQTMAIATTIRNISIALLIAKDCSIDAIQTVFAFYVASLIVAAIQANKWAGQPDTAPVAPASQPQAAVIAAGRGVTSTP